MSDTPFDPEAVKISHRVHDDLEIPDMSALSGPLTPGGGLSERSEVSAAYADTILDLHELMDELRFEASLGALFIFDHQLRLKRGELEANDPHDELLPGMKVSTGQLGVSVEAMALMAAYCVPPPSAHDLFTNPYQHLSGHRVLGCWFAGQLFDAAATRFLAALDRIAILLWVAAGRDLNPDRYPAFRAATLKMLASHYSSRVGWAELIALTDSEMFSFVKGWRDRFVHRRRQMSELHQGKVVVHHVDAGGNNVRIKGVDPETHLAIVIGAYKGVLVPAIDLSIKVLNQTDTGNRSAGATARPS